MISFAFTEMRLKISQHRIDFCIVPIAILCFFIQKLLPYRKIFFSNALNVCDGLKWPILWEIDISLATIY